MTLDARQLQQDFRASILDIAPEADIGGLQPHRPLRTQLDIDSFDFLRILERLHERSGIDVPEADYPKLETLERADAYLLGRAAQ